MRLNTLWFNYTAINDNKRDIKITIQFSKETEKKKKNRFNFDFNRMTCEDQSEQK